MKLPIERKDGKRGDTLQLPKRPAPLPMIDLNEVGNLPRVGPQAPLPMFSPGRRPPLIIARDQEPSEPGQNQQPFHGWSSP